MITGVYIGKLDHLRGRRAILQERQMHPGGKAWAAQFNDLDLGLHNTHSWMIYSANCFQVENNMNLDFNVGGIA